MMGGVEGVLRNPTNENDEAKLITVLTKDHPFEGEHDEHGRLGGIGLKVSRISSGRTLRFGPLVSGELD